MEDNFSRGFTTACITILVISILTFVFSNIEITQQKGWFIDQESIRPFAVSGCNFSSIIKTQQARTNIFIELMAPSPDHGWVPFDPPIAIHRTIDIPVTRYCKVNVRIKND